MFSCKNGPHPHQKRTILSFMRMTQCFHKKEGKKRNCFQKRIMSSVFLLLLLFHPQGLKRLVSHVKCGVLTCCLGADRLICFLMLLYCLCLSFKTSLPLAVGGRRSICAVAASAKQKSSRFQAVIVYTAAFPQKKAGVAALGDTPSHKRSCALIIVVCWAWFVCTEVVCMCRPRFFADSVVPD